jgi:putative tricarboxylic transport membrane protein
MFLINVVSFVMLALWLKPFSMIVKIPTKLLAVVIMCVSLVGIYAMNTRVFDAGVAIVMGVLGYILLRLKWPVVNLVVGIVLGEILEGRLRESLSLGDGSPLIFFERPITVFILILTAATIFIPLVKDRMRDRRGKKAETGA